jgi:hypothetical protein
VGCFFQDGGCAFGIEARIYLFHAEEFRSVLANPGKL